MLVNKVMTWVLIMTLFFSQSYAYAFVPCESNAHGTSQHITDMGSNSLAPQSLASMTHSMLESDMANHMQHNMMQDTQQKKPAMDCCDQECSCLTGTCASVTLSHFITSTTLLVVSDSAGFYLFSIQDAFLPSLNKPPIIG